MQKFEWLSVGFVLLYFLDTHTVRMIELKDQASRPRNKKVVNLDISCNLVTKISN